MIMLDSRGGGAPMEREAAGIPTETAYASETGDLPDVEPAAAAPVAAGNEEKKEEDVSIADLPF